MTGWARWPDFRCTPAWRRGRMSVRSSKDFVASELWHFLGYDGAFIAFSRPSTRRTLAYWSDLDDAINSSRRLRALILHIAENTDAERIHVLACSAGTRLVARTLADLGLYGYLLDEEELHRRTKLGHVILVGSDVGRSIMMGYLLDGALRVPETLTIYQSSADSDLGLSRRVFGRNRVGQVRCRRSRSSRRQGLPAAASRAAYRRCHRCRGGSRRQRAQLFS